MHVWIPEGFHSTRNDSSQDHLFVSHRHILETSHTNIIGIWHCVRPEGFIWVYGLEQAQIWLGAVWPLKARETEDARAPWGASRELSRSRVDFLFEQKGLILKTAKYLQTRSERGQADLVWPQELSLLIRQSLGLCQGLCWAPRGRSWTSEDFVWSRAPPSRKISFYTCQQINGENCFQAVIGAILGSTGKERLILEQQQQTPSENLRERAIKQLEHVLIISYRSLCLLWAFPFCWLAMNFLHYHCLFTVQHLTKVINQC